MKGQRPTGPLVLVVESDLPSAEKENFKNRGGLFVTALQIQKPEDIPKSVKTAWLDASLSDKQVERLKGFINTDKVALYEGSAALMKLRGILDRKLRPLKPYKSAEETNNEERNRRIEQYETDPMMLENRQLRSDLERANNKLKLYEDERVAQTTSLPLRIKLDQLQSEKERLRLRISLLESNQADVGIRILQGKVTRLENQNSNLEKKLARVKDEYPKLNSLLNELEREARGIEVNYGMLKLNVIDPKIRSLSYQDIIWLQKIEKQLREHVEKLRSLIKSIS